MRNSRQIAALLTTARTLILENADKTRGAKRRKELRAIDSAVADALFVLASRR